jgi:hypothetical protein
MLGHSQPRHPPYPPPPPPPPPPPLLLLLLLLILILLLLLLLILLLLLLRLLLLLLLLLGCLHVVEGLELALKSSVHLGNNRPHLAAERAGHAAGEVGGGAHLAGVRVRVTVGVRLRVRDWGEG